MMLSVLDERQDAMTPRESKFDSASSLALESWRSSRLPFVERQLHHFGGNDGSLQVDRQRRAFAGTVDIDVRHRDALAQRRRERPAGDVPDGPTVHDNGRSLPGDAFTFQLQTDQFF